LGRPTYLGNEITQSVDFSIKTPPAIGLIQVWQLETRLDEFLENSKNYSSLNFKTFDTKKGRKGLLNYTIWDYTFTTSDAEIHSLEAFFDDKPYMYRISLYVKSKDYGPEVRKIFDEMVNSVSVK
ncbi:MAG: hypothetical protein N2376_09380, partial [Clostridia bacterium]|nr:hypothetical protein [Clostridia bacterium]